MYGKCFTTAKVTAGLVLATLLLTVGQTRGQDATGQGWPINHPTGSSSYPWNSSGYRGYNEPRHVPQPVELTAIPAQPSKYQLNVNAVADKNAEAPNSATVVAHVPANAKIWFEGGPTTSTGEWRHYYSPPLIPGKTYTYTVRMDWMEDGKQVSKTQDFPLKAGDIHCLYLIQSDSKLDPEKDVVEANLSQLSQADRELVHAQKFCAVQGSVPLGAMGVPVKVMVNKEPVFLCCEACRTRAEKNPEKTLAKVKELKEKPGTLRDK